VTVRSTFAEFLHHNWQLTAEEAVSMRRAEDTAAAKRLGAAHRHWSLPDAIYRLDPSSGEPLYTSDEDIFGVLDDSEQTLVGELAQQIGKLPQHKQLLVPLGIGSHVDHQLVRMAAEAACGDGLLYYEDYPYVQRDPSAIRELLQPREQWRSTTVRLSQEALQAKIEAIACYRSQLGVLFGGEEEMAEQVRKQGSERLWYRSAQA
jgi:LmbE family N-acetylglucosaminyl deacetylase